LFPTIKFPYNFSSEPSTDDNKAHHKTYNIIKKGIENMLVLVTDGWMDAHCNKLLTGNLASAKYRRTNNRCLETVKEAKKTVLKRTICGEELDQNMCSEELNQNIKNMISQINHDSQI
jgi:hypothetical protein